MTYFLTSDQLHRQVDTQLHNRGREAGRLVKFLRTGGTPAPATSALDLGDVGALASGSGTTASSTTDSTSAASPETAARSSSATPARARRKRVGASSRSARNLFGRLPPNPDQVRGYQQVVDAHGKILARSAQSVSLPADARTRALATHGGAPFLRDMRLHGVHLRVLAEPFGSGRAVQLALPLTEVDSLLSRLRLILTLLVVGGIALAALLGRLVAGAAVQPLKRLDGGYRARRRHPRPQPPHRTRRRR